MKREVIYELPIYSSALMKDPIIKWENMNVVIELIGVDDNEKIKKVSFQFNTVLCNKHTSVRFTPKLYDSYDKVVELLNSEWLEELKNVNKEYFDFWCPRHYALFLDEIGLFEFIAQGYEVREYE